MEKSDEKLIETLTKKMYKLDKGQLKWLERIIEIYECDYQYTLHKSTYLKSESLNAFGDALRVHHAFSAESFSKDKFEYVLANVLSDSGHETILAPKGNPGYDLSCDGVKFSLKTQADKSIKADQLHISKFMELGKGKWDENIKDLEGLREAFLRHLQNYERILILRALSAAKKYRGQYQCCYELVEIPKNLLMMASTGQLDMMMNSKQRPKPGYCYVRSGEVQVFQLYFDGGGERKLQIRKLLKSCCEVHATWEFSLNPPQDSSAQLQFSL